MTREEAMAEVRRMRLLDPGARWIATPRGREWRVTRLGRPPGAKRKPTRGGHSAGTGTPHGQV
jgi:hypothetical protein